MLIKRIAVTAAALAISLGGAANARADAGMPDSADSVQLGSTVDADAGGIYIAGCYASATKPFTVTHGSRDINAEGKITKCFGSPDACHFGVDLEQYNARTHQWHVVAHNGGSWTSCKGKVQAHYKNCTYDRYTEWKYRSSIYLIVMKNGRTGTMGHRYSAENEFYCQ